MRSALGLLVACLALSACSGFDGSTYTLYRTSLVIQDARLHVATFDAEDGEKYNSGNCEAARELFQSQPGVKTRYWCERGRFRK